MEFEINELAEKLDEMFFDFSEKVNKNIEFKFEPGRYLIAECAVLLGKVHAVKTNGRTKYSLIFYFFNYFFKLGPILDSIISFVLFFIPRIMI